MSTKIKIFLGALAFAVALSAGSASAQTYTFSGTLKQGSRGTSVWNLQKFLNLCPATRVASVGAGSPGMETQTFGPATKAAVIRFQAANGLSADGIFGSMSAAKAVSLQMSGAPCGSVVVVPPAGLPAGCTSTSGFSPLTGQACSSTTTPSGSLSGGAGELEQADFIASVSNEDVGEDESDVQVLGLELEADSGSDLRLTAIRVEFEEQNAGGSDELEDYADEVSIWLGSTQIGSADVEDFDEDEGVYSETISLSNSAVIKAGATARLYVAVSALSNIDSDDLGSSNNDWDVGVATLRYVDAQGAVVTENSLDDIGSDLGTDQDESRDFQFVSFASAADVNLKVSLNRDEDDVNDAHTITVDEDDETEDVSVLAFNLEAEGDSDISITEIPVLFTTNDSNISTVISSASLYQGDEEIANEDIDSTGTTELITFEDLDIEIGADDEEEFWVKVTILEQDGNYTNGSATIRAQILDAQVNDIEAEDETGEELGDDELDGSASADALTLNTTSAAVKVTSHSSDENEDGTVGTFSFEFTVSADGEDDVVFDINDVIYEVLGPSTLDGNEDTATLTFIDGDGEDSGGTMTVDEGGEATFAFDVTIDPNASDESGSYRVRLTDVAGTSLGDGVLAGPETLTQS